MIKFIKNIFRDRLLDDPPTRSIKFKSGTEKDITGHRYIPFLGEPCIKTDDFSIRMGDGKTQVKDLPVIGFLPDYLHDLYLGRK